MGNYYHSSYMHGKSVKRSGNFHHRDFDVDEYDEQQPSYDKRPLQSYPEDEPWTYVGCPLDRAHETCQRDPHTDSIIIATNGICTDNGKPRARGALGVFFHHCNNTFNRALTLPLDKTHTSQRAQLHAAWEAIRLAKDIRARNGRGKLSRHMKRSPLVRLHHVVIVTDADYVARGMSEWVWKWEGNGYVNARGRPVVNADLFWAMQRDIEWLNARDVHVDFWRVGRGAVEPANCLARAALRGVGC